MSEDVYWSTGITDLRQLPRGQATLLPANPPRPSGRLLPLEVSNPHDEQGRRRYNVGVRKLARADRDIARSVMPDVDSVTSRGFFAINPGADLPDDDEDFPIGVDTSYSVLLTDAEAEQFREASNLRWIKLDRAVERQAAEEEGPLPYNVT